MAQVWVVDVLIYVVAATTVASGDAKEHDSIDITCALVAS